MKMLAANSGIILFLMLSFGLVHGTAAVEFDLAKQRVGSWSITSPIAGARSISFYFLLNALLR